MERTFKLIIEEDGKLRLKTDGEFSEPELIYLLEYAKMIILQGRANQPVETEATGE